MVQPTVLEVKMLITTIILSMFNREIKNKFHFVQLFFGLPFLIFLKPLINIEIIEKSYVQNLRKCIHIFTKGKKPN